MAGRKGFLPDGKVLPVGKACTSLTGRVAFQPARYTRISARIPAKAGGYPPGDADAAFPGKGNRISASVQISGCNATISNFDRVEKDKQALQVHFRMKRDPS
ncbi:hypothetical protein PGTUg99_002073 [Puccinia graminis f. sp. tritici]|uniref:Uncharacterized protein n=1 Tax=Puccinia graminis f. sp. tritici TaxID=56615 RepID=A0A5B0PSC3_PUCGR|nr:hypothetical protein PGTUg99_002073 [Puccinia graminis f. sp. tritici]